MRIVDCRLPIVDLRLPGRGLTTKITNFLYISLHALGGSLIFLAKNTIMGWV